MKTHGEAWYAKKLYNNTVKGFDKFDTDTGIPKRMSRADATTYYNRKCRKAFEKLGFKYKDKSKTFDISFILKQVQRQTKIMLAKEVRENRALFNAHYTDQNTTESAA